MMHAIECHPMDQIFSHEDPDGTMRHFNISYLVRLTLDRKCHPWPVKAGLTEKIVNHVLSNHGVEEAHLSKISDAMMQEPVIFANFPEKGTEGTQLLIDGAHRVVKTWSQGKTEINALIYLPQDWERCLVTGFSEELDLQDIVNLVGVVPLLQDQPTPLTKI